LQVDCFHALRRSDPPFVSPALFLMQGLAPFVCTESSWCFLVHYFFFET
jgi:hypothetical protein